MTCFSSRSASAYFLAVSVHGGQRLLRVIDDPGDHQIGVCAWRFGTGGDLTIDAIKARYS